MSSPPSSHRRNTNPKTRIDASHLLNFRCSKPPPPPQSSRPRPPPKRNTTSQAEKRVRKALSSQFYLHASSDHAFLLSPSAPSLDNPDIAVRWEHILLVKNLVTSLQTSCPICLDSYASPRITKCGHSFCFPCILHHLQTAEKCPCCTETVYMDDLRPVAFESVMIPKLHQKMTFVKLHRAKQSHVPFRPNSSAIMTDDDDENAKFCRFRFVGNGNDQTTYLDKLRGDGTELEDALKRSSEELERHFVIMAMEAVKFEHNRVLKEISERSKSTKEDRPSPKPQRPSPSEPDEDASYTQFYQSSDGQLCYLSSFNMRCLTTEHQTDLSRLPDRIEGQIIDIETIHLTTDIRKKLTFLSHLPLYADVKLVELSLQNYLSDDTKRLYKKEMETRKKKRRNKAQAEKKADRIAKEKAGIRQRREIDANDEFFHQPLKRDEASFAIGDDFGPGLGGHGGAGAVPVERPNYTRPPDSVFSLKKASQTNGVWPELKDAAKAKDAATVLPKKVMPTAAAPAWGVVTPTKTAVRRETNPTPPSSLPTPSSSSKGRGKGKGKKVLLFSTGGHRGGY